MKMVLLKDGETLHDVGQRHGLSVERLLTANPEIKSVDETKRGTKVRIPDITATVIRPVDAEVGISQDEGEAAQRHNPWVPEWVQSGDVTAYDDQMPDYQSEYANWPMEPSYPYSANWPSASYAEAWAASTYPGVSEFQPAYDADVVQTVPAKAKAKTSRQSASRKRPRQTTSRRSSKRLTENQMQDDEEIKSTPHLTSGPWRPNQYW